MPGRRRPCARVDTKGISSASSQQSVHQNPLMHRLQTATWFPTLALDFAPCCRAIGPWKSLCVWLEYLGAAPDVVGVAAGPEALGLDHGGRLGEAVRQRLRVVGVAAERHRVAALLAPPADDLRRQLPPRVDLQGP